MEEKLSYIIFKNINNNSDNYIIMLMLKLML